MAPPGGSRVHAVAIRCATWLAQQVVEATYITVFASTKWTSSMTCHASMIGTRQRLTCVQWMLSALTREDHVHLEPLPVTAPVHRQQTSPTVVAVTTTAMWCPAYPPQVDRGCDGLATSMLTSHPWYYPWLPHRPVYLLWPQHLNLQLLLFIWHILLVYQH